MLMNASYVTGGAKAAQAIAKQPKAIHHQLIYLINVILPYYMLKY